VGPSRPSESGPVPAAPNPERAAARHGEEGPKHVLFPSPSVTEPCYAMLGSQLQESRSPSGNTATTATRDAPRTSSTAPDDSRSRGRTLLNQRLSRPWRQTWAGPSSLPDHDRMPCRSPIIRKLAFSSARAICSSLSSLGYASSRDPWRPVWGAAARAGCCPARSGARAPAAC